MKPRPPTPYEVEKLQRLVTYNHAELQAVKAARDAGTLKVSRALKLKKSIAMQARMERDIAKRLELSGVTAQEVRSGCAVRAAAQDERAEKDGPGSMIHKIATEARGGGQ